MSQFITFLVLTIYSQSVYILYVIQYCNIVSAAHQIPPSFIFIYCMYPPVGENGVSFLRLAMSLVFYFHICIYKSIFGSRSKENQTRREPYKLWTLTLSTRTRAKCCKLISNHICPANKCYTMLHSCKVCNMGLQLYIFFKKCTFFSHFHWKFAKSANMSQKIFAKKSLWVSKTLKFMLIWKVKLLILALKMLIKSYKPRKMCKNKNTQN